jgi:hypothetical protein
MRTAVRMRMLKRRRKRGWNIVKKRREEKGKGSGD